LAGAMYWWAQSFDLWLQIVAGYRPPVGSSEHNRLYIFYYTLCSGAPAVFVALYAGLELLGAGDGANGFCFVNSQNDPFYRYEYIHYYWTSVFAFHGVYNILHIMITLFRSARASKLTDQAGHWKIYVRPIIFWWCFFLLFASIISYRVYAFQNTTTWQESAKAWVTCLLVTQYAVPGTNCGLKPVPGPSSTTFIYVHFIVGIQGFIEFVIYGTQYDNLVQWGKLIIATCCTCAGIKTTGSRVDAGSKTGSAGSQGESSGTRTRQITKRKEQESKAGDSKAESRVDTQAVELESAAKA